MNSRNYIKFKSTGGPEKMSQRTGIYADDIANYKRLYYAANNDDDGNKDIDKKLLQSASNLYNSVVNAWFNNPYSDLQKKQFNLQAERIRTDIDRNLVEINKEVNMERTFSLNEYLVKAGITDYNGKLLPTIKDKQTLRKLWLKKLPEYFPYYFDDSNFDPLRRKQFTKTFNMLAMGLPEVLPASEES